MSEQDTGAEPIISDSELEADLTPSGTETLEELQQRLANAERAKKQILARARKAEERLKEFKPAETPKATAPQDTNLDDRLWEVAEMIQQGYTRADAEFVSKNGGREALKDPNSYVSVAIRTLHEQRRAESAVDNTTHTAGMSEIERKFTPEQLKNMSVEELEKILPHAEAN